MGFSDVKKTGETAPQGNKSPGRVVEYGIVDCRPLMDDAFRLGMPAGCFRIRRRECRHTAAKGAAEDAAATVLPGDSVNQHAKLAGHPEIPWQGF